MKASQNIDRLGFCEAAKHNFAFLEDYGFRVLEQTSNSLTYSSRKVFAHIYQEPYSFEMGVRLSLRNTSLNVDLQDITDYSNAPERNSFRDRTIFQTSSSEGVKKLVPEMARIVSVYGKPFLNGVSGAYKMVEQRRAHGSSALMLAMQLRSARAKLAIAWRAKRYDEVVEVLRPIRQHLSPAEQKKLQYAERKVEASLAEQ